MKYLESCAMTRISIRDPDSVMVDILEPRVIEITQYRYLLITFVREFVISEYLHVI